MILRPDFVRWLDDQGVDGRRLALALASDQPLDPKTVVEVLEIVWAFDDELFAIGTRLEAREIAVRERELAWRAQVDAVGRPTLKKPTPGRTAWEHIIEAEG